MRKNGHQLGGNRLCQQHFYVEKGFIEKVCWIKWATGSILFCGVWPLISWFLLFSIYWERFVPALQLLLGRRLDSSGNCINSFKPLGCYSVNYFSVIKDATTQKHNVRVKWEVISLPTFPSCLFVIREEIGLKYVGITQWQSSLLS